MIPVDKNQKLDETRRKLLASREKLETELSKQFDDISVDASRIGKKALALGGGLFLTYQLVKLIVKDDEEDEEILDEKVSVKRDRKGRPLKVEKKQKIGLSFGQLLKQQAISIGMLIISAQVKKQLKKSKLIDE